MGTPGVVGSAMEYRNRLGAPATLWVLTMSGSRVPLALTWPGVGQPS